MSKFSIPLGIPSRSISPPGACAFGFWLCTCGFQEISPIHNISKGAPSTIILSGTEDKIIPVTTLKAYQTKMQKIGSRCDLVVYENVGHAFFAKSPVKYFIETTFEIDLFLKSLSYLN